MTLNLLISAPLDRRREKLRRYFGGYFFGGYE
jgi:hypothetical protein